MQKTNDKNKYDLCIIKHFNDKKTPEYLYDFLKPGSHTLVFTDIKNYHKIANNFEESNFEIREQIVWIFEFENEIKHIPILVARKQINKNTSLIDNIIKNGSGAININDSRIFSENLPQKCLGYGWSSQDRKNYEQGYRPNSYYQDKKVEYVPSPKGRWPSNVIIEKSEKIKSKFPESKTGAMKKYVKGYKSNKNTNFLNGNSGPHNQYGDSGSALRFFYTIDNNNILVPYELLKYLTIMYIPPNGKLLNFNNDDDINKITKDLNLVSHYYEKIG